ncbi:MAG: EamA family transporter [Verrucomicrobiales bacterium]|nr:EamA family transporter [Verrucomicrobiales bacterium]
MKSWVIFAFLSMLFAGVTSVIAKMGLNGISADAGMAVRTCFVFVFVLLFASVSVSVSQLRLLDSSNYLWLGLSAATTTLSWIFYYKALQEGDVSKIAIIDKGSVVVAIVLAALILKEQITPKTFLGGALVVSGILVIAKK